MNEFGKLKEYLRAERLQIEYWRWSKSLRELSDFQNDLTERSFVTQLQAPEPPNREAEEDKFWEQLVNEIDSREPYAVALNTTIAIAAFVIAIVVGLTLSHFWNGGFSCLGGAISGAAIAAVGLGLTASTRRRCITSEAELVFEKRFEEQWSQLRSSFQLEHERFLASLQDQQASWQASEQKRIAILKSLMAGHAESTKSAIARALESQPHLSLDSMFVSADCGVSACLEIPDLQKIVNAKSKQISDKSGKIVSRTKPKEERELNYSVFAAGSALTAIVDILNSAPACSELRIALFSNQNTRKAFHVSGIIKRDKLPSLNWETVAPQNLLVTLGFRIEGGKAKKHTGPPEWLSKLQSVQIGTSSSAKST